jgi:peptidylprolyl isomerase
MAQEVRSGDTVKVHYHGRLTDGTTFDSSEGRQPLEFEVGSGAVIKGFDEGVMGMAVGQKKTIEIPVDDAYGPRDPEAIIEFPIERRSADTGRHRRGKTRSGCAGRESSASRSGPDL